MDRVSDEHLAKAIIGQSEYFASFRAGIDCIGGAQAKAGYDALLDLRDCRAERDAAQAHVRNHHMEACETCAACESERDALKLELDDLRNGVGLPMQVEQERMRSDRLRALLVLAREWMSAGDYGEEPTLTALLADIDAALKTEAGENDAASGVGGSTPHRLAPEPVSAQAATPALSAQQDLLDAIGRTTAALNRADAAEAACARMREAVESAVGFAVAFRQDHGDEALRFPEVGRLFAVMTVALATDAGSALLEVVRAAKAYNAAHMRPGDPRTSEEIISEMRHAGDALRAAVERMEGK